MKKRFFCTVIMFLIVGLLFSDCNRKPACVSILDDPAVIDISKQPGNFNSFLDRLKPLISFDTLYVFNPYVSRDTIGKYLSCYDKAFDRISSDDGTALLVLESKGRLYYRYIGRFDDLFEPVLKHGKE